MEAKIELNKDALETALQAAILQQINEIGRDNIIAKAIEYLTTPQEVYSGKKEKPLMHAFYNATERVMKQLIEEEIKSKDSLFRAKIKDIVSVGVEEWLNDSKDDISGLSSKIASAINKAITPDGRYY